MAALPPVACTGNKGDSVAGAIEWREGSAHVAISIVAKLFGDALYDFVVEDTTIAHFDFNGFADRELRKIAEDTVAEIAAVGIDDADTSLTWENRARAIVPTYIVNVVGRGHFALSFEAQLNNASVVDTEVWDSEITRFIWSDYPLDDLLFGRLSIVSIVAAFVDLEV